MKNYPMAIMNLRFVKVVSTLFLFQMLLNLWLIALPTYPAKSLTTSTFLKKKSLNQGTNHMLSQSSDRFGTKVGLDELKAILEVSQQTQSPNIRQVILTVPSETPAEMKADYPSIVAIREFYLIVIDDTTIRKKAPRNPRIEGLEGSLPNGGSITVRLVDGVRSSVTMKVKQHGISGFEQVNQINFVVQ